MFIQIIMAVVIVALIIALIRDVLHRRKMYEHLDDPVEEIPAVTVRARVLSKRAEIKNIGNSKYPRSTLFCYVTFATDEGELVEYSLPKEDFGAINEQDYGTLITVNGKFLAFDIGQ